MGGGDAAAIPSWQEGPDQDAAAPPQFTPVMIDLSAVLPAQLQMAGKESAYPRRRSPELVQFLCMLHRAKSPWLQDVGHGSASQFQAECDQFRAIASSV